MHKSHREPVQVEKYCSSLDIMPTLANLFGLEYDSRLGYEPTMEYMTDREHLEWKIAMTERALTELEPIYEAAKEKLAK